MKDIKRIQNLLYSPNKGVLMTSGKGKWEEVSTASVMQKHEAEQGTPVFSAVLFSFNVIFENCTNCPPYREGCEMKPRRRFCLLKTEDLAGKQLRLRALCPTAESEVKHHATLTGCKSKSLPTAEKQGADSFFSFF